MIVMTLDAGGTNFVFSAIEDFKEVIEPVALPAKTNTIEECLDTLVKGFTLVKEQLKEEPVAISFAFPGPADYKHGIIGDLINLPCFRGGIALGPYLQKQFGIPTFINNDGNLFAYGEALVGALPKVNEMLNESGAKRRYHNLVGITLGTGFGCGVVINHVLLSGDNDCGGDVWCMRNTKYPDLIAEESVSIRAVRRVYGELSGTDASALTPKDIYDIAEGTREGDMEAAKGSFRELGQGAAAGIINALNIADGVVVIGGGVAGAAKYILPGMMEEFRRKAGTFAGGSFSTLQSEVYNIEDPEECAKFLEDGDTMVKIPGTDEEVFYARQNKIPVMLSQLGASRAIMLGAYTYAINNL